MQLTQAQQTKEIEETTKKVDILTIVIIIGVLIACTVIGITIGKMLFNIAMSNA